MTRLGRYRDPLAAWIKRLKYGGKHTWAAELGGRLGEAAAEHLQAMTLVPVPMHWVRRTTRGLDHASLIAEGMSAATGWPVCRLLRRTRLTAPQSRVPVSGRVANLVDAIGLRERDGLGRRLQLPERVLLVDDIKTTGATLGRCAGVLKRAGVAEIHAAVLGVAEP